jgi:hypothetical protein
MATASRRMVVPWRTPYSGAAQSGFDARPRRRRAEAPRADPPHIGSRAGAAYSAGRAVFGGASAKTT